MIDLQKARGAPSPDEEVTKLSASLKESEIKLRQVSDKNEELNIIVQSLEQSNKDILSDMGTLIQRIDNPKQTSKGINNQVVKQLNSRIDTLQGREEKAIEAAQKAEEVVNALKKQLHDERSCWLSERSSLQQSRDNRNNRASQTEEDESLSFERQRLEKRMDEFNKEASLYQMKLYEVQKDNHEIKEKYGLKTSQHIEEVGKLKREIIHLKKRCESLEENLGEASSARTTFERLKNDLQLENESLKRKIEEYLDCLLYTSPSPRDS